MTCFTVDIKTQRCLLLLLVRKSEIIDHLTTFCDVAEMTDDPDQTVAACTLHALTHTYTHTEKKTHIDLHQPPV